LKKLIKIASLHSPAVCRIELVQACRRLKRWCQEVDSCWILWSWTNLNYVEDIPWSWRWWVLCRELLVKDLPMDRADGRSMLTIWFMEMDDQDTYMMKKKLMYHQITDQVESCYLNLLDKEEWMLAKNTMLSKQVWS
jgi:hypothetical protein